MFIKAQYIMEERAERKNIHVVSNLLGELKKIICVDESRKNFARDAFETIIALTTGELAGQEEYFSDKSQSAKPLYLILFRKYLNNIFEILFVLKSRTQDCFTVNFL